MRSGPIRCRLIEPARKGYRATIVCESDPSHSEQVDVDAEIYAAGWDATKAAIGERVCNVCGSPSRMRGRGTYTIWSTEDGTNNRPGDMWWDDCWTLKDPKIAHCYFLWHDCDGRHLYVRLPDGRAFSPDQRASNCGKMDDHAHRCWRRVGDPPNVSIVGSGCGGSWSIGAAWPDGWHGWLNNGVLTDA